MVFEQSSTPRYVEIADDLRGRINRGEWEPGDPFLSHQEIKEQYGVSSTTAAGVRSILLSQGILEPRPGARMTVRRPPERRRIDRTSAAPESSAHPLREQEITAGRAGEWASKTRWAQTPREIAELLRVEAGSKAVVTDYQFRSAGRLVRLARCWEPDALVGGTVVQLPEEGPYAGRGVVERMEALGIGPLTVRDELVACPASHDEAQLLAVGLGSPVLRATRVYTGPDGRPVHVEQSVVRGETSSMIYRLSAG
jgi:GntR family transcriptional regulator